MSTSLTLFNIQQDGAPAHVAPDTVQLLGKQMPDVMGPEIWLPNSPNLRPWNLGTITETWCLPRAHL